MKTALKCLCGGEVTRFSDMHSTGAGRNSYKPQLRWVTYYRCTECGLSSESHPNENQALQKWQEMQQAVKINKEKNNEPKNS